MTKIVFGIILTLFVINYSNEIITFTVETGIRDRVVIWLNDLILLIGSYT